MLSGARFEGVPPTGALGRTDGVFVHAWDEDDPSDQKWFWVYHPGPFRSWDAVELWIDFGIENYGLEPA